MKIKAFTIAEVMISLAISAIVIGIGYYALYTIGANSTNRMTKIGQISKVQELRFLLQKDFNSYHDWQSISLNQLSSERGNIAYHFKENELLRIQPNHTSSFSFEEIKFAITDTLNQYQLTIQDLSQQFSFQLTPKNNLMLELK